MRAPSFERIRVGARERWARDCDALLSAGGDLDSVVAIAFDCGQALPVAFVAPHADAIARLEDVDREAATLVRGASLALPASIVIRRFRNGLLDLEIDRFTQPAR